MSLPGPETFSAAEMIHTKPISMLVNAYKTNIVMVREETKTDTISGPKAIKRAKK
jgi:hypothetical protein